MFKHMFHKTFTVTFNNWSGIGFRFNNSQTKQKTMISGNFQSLFSIFYAVVTKVFLILFDSNPAKLFSFLSTVS